ncbi:MAG TPA: ATP-binding protein [Pyrinomonadaceae bacterium]|nr:ATP-binding protein [Pyrinomonadaceae bacterium]
MRNRFSDFWVLIVKTRVLLCVVVWIFSVFGSSQINIRVIVASVIYFLINIALGLVGSVTLRRKRVRLLPAILDVLLVTYLVSVTGGQTSPWFLLYLFPILSVSRYLSSEGSVPLAIFAAMSYSIAIWFANPDLDVKALLLKGLVLLGVGLVAGNLAKTTKHKEEDLIEIFHEIDRAILTDTDLARLLRLILQKAIVFTGSDFGEMRLFGEDEAANPLTIKADVTQPDWAIDTLGQRYREKTLESHKPFSILAIKGTQSSQVNLAPDVQEIGEGLTYVLLAYVLHADNLPGSALFVPLVLDDEVKAVISLFSKDRFHYSQSEAIKLGSFAPLLGIALKHRSMYQELTASERDKNQRLKMLNEIAEQLRIEQGLTDIFEKVVTLAWNLLNSEEAALFVADEGNGQLIKKVAVKGPSQSITSQLAKIEKPYEPGESLVGEVFQKKRPIHLAEVSSDVQYQEKYAQTLPSSRVQHYIGVPLVIGDEVLGVLRVINKRAPGYSIEKGTLSLSDKGFAAEDVELLQTIASQVVSAIRSAKFLDVQRFHRELIENSPDPIIVLDKKGRIKVFNKACETIWGFKAAEVINTHVTQYYKSPEHAFEIGDLLEKDKSDHRLRDFNAWIKAADGEIIPISLSASLIFDSEGNKDGSIGVFKDLRVAQKLQEEKTNAERLATLGKLAHTVGHEIKHDIATALNYVDTLAYETDDEELVEIYRDVQESLLEAVDKFQNMLLVGRPKPPEKRIVGADEILGLVETQMLRRVRSRDIEVRVTNTADEELNADISQLRQVLLNLFDNSLDAIEYKKHHGMVDTRGLIELSAQARNGDLQIVWKDNGCGIPRHKLTNIFTPFVTSKETGNGLGLFIVKNIIENHGGKVSVDSEEGKGTTFNITLPLRKAQ